MQATKTFRVFISSTFSDMKKERDALQKYVFPKLGELCNQHDCRFQAIDLRWGVSEEAGLDQATMKICLDEIARSQRITPRPNFLVLIGDRYGWQPLPSEIESDEFNAILSHVGGQMDRSLLNDWYKLDANAIPPAYILLPRKDAFEDPEVWENLETKIRSILLYAAKEIPLDEENRQKYEASAVEREVQLGALNVPDAGNHVYCYFRTIRNLPETPSARFFTDLDESGKPNLGARFRLDNLKRRLREELPDNIFEYEAEWKDNSISEDHIGALNAPSGKSGGRIIRRKGKHISGKAASSLCQNVYDSLSRVILEEISLLENTDRLDKEIAAHESLCLQHTRFFTGRVKALNTISEYVDSFDRRPLMVHGVSGSGKSALMAQSIKQAFNRWPGATIIFRFLGTTPGSSDERALLESLCLQISRTYGASQSAIPKDYESLIEDFAARLTLATADHPLILFLDAVDQLSEIRHQGNHSWLTQELPRHVHLIISTPPGDCLALIEKELPATSLFELEPMSQQESEQLLDLWLKDAGRLLQQDQRKLLINGFNKCPLPLYFKLAFEECRHWRSFNETSEIGEDIASIIDTLFTRLSSEAAHGEILTSHSLGYLAATRNGLAEAELLDLLSADEEVKADFKQRSPLSPAVDKLPVIVWSRLYHDLEPYLAERYVGGVLVLTFYHRQIAKAAARFLSRPSEYQARHNSLAEHFRNAADPHRDLSWSGESSRGFSELAYHLYEYARSSGLDDELYALAKDEKFRERQFEVLTRLEPIVECLSLAIRQATDSQDVAASMRYALIRGELNRSLARSFLYRLHSISRTNPQLAISIAGLNPQPANRLMALILVAWVLADISEQKATTRRLLADIQASKDNSFAPHQSALVLNIIYDLVEKGFDGATEIIQKIPDSPVREAYHAAWRNGSRPARSLGARLARKTNNTATPAQWKQVSQVEGYVRKVAHQYFSRASAEQLEENAARLFGVEGPEQAWTLVAADAIASGRKTKAVLCLNRALYSTSESAFKPVRTMIAMKQALEAAGERYLAEEYKSKVSTWIDSLHRMGGDQKTLAELKGFASALDASSEMTPDVWSAPDPRAQSNLGKTFQDKFNKPEIETLLDQAMRLVASSRKKDAAALLEQALNLTLRIGSAPERAGVEMAIFALACLTDSISVRDQCLSRLQSRSLNPELLFSLSEPAAQEQVASLNELFDAALFGGHTSIAAIALALRLAGKPAILYLFLRHLCSRGTEVRMLDAVLAQLVLMSGSNADSLRQINNELEFVDRNTGVAQGLGFYYGDFIWSFLFWTGLFLMAISSSADCVTYVGALLILVPTVGSLLDLLVWRRLGLWKKPEISRRYMVINFCSTVMNLGLILALSGPAKQLSMTMRISALVTTTLTFACGLLVGRWAIFSGHFWRFELRLHLIVASVALICSLVAALAAARLIELTSLEVFKGIFIAGCLTFGMGLSLLTKHIPVRRYYNAKGIKIGDEERTNLGINYRVKEISPFEIDTNSRLSKQIRRAEKSVKRRKFRRAVRQYTEIIQSPDATTMPETILASCYLNRGMALRNLRNQSDAISDLQRAAQLDAKSYKPHHNLGLVLAQDLGRYPEALKSFGKALELNPRDVDSLSSRGIVKTLLEDWGGAEADYRMALMLDPSNPDALTNFANLRLRQGLKERALDLYQKAYDENPDDIELCLNYANLLYHLGSVEACLSTLRQNRRALRIWLARHKKQKNI